LIHLAIVFFRRVRLGVLMGKKAVVLLSGGLDSATVLAISREEGFENHCLSFSYGQRHSVELVSAAKVAASLGAVEHRVVDIDLRAFGGSALTADIDVPKNNDGTFDGSNIPVTYVPARNIIFLSFALGMAEVIGAGDVFIGANAVDYSGYPDCRPEFIDAFAKMAAVGTKAGVEGRAVRFNAPIISLSKADIIRRGVRLGVDYSLTHSCYDPDSEGLSCGGCDSCLLRKKGFLDAGVPDPTRYV